MSDDAVDLHRAAALLAAARVGEAGAFDALITLCRPIVERHARRHAWADRDADDIVQEVWIRLFRHATTIRDPQSLIGWLKVVTRRTALELGRRNARMVPTELGDEHPSGGASTEDQALLHHDRGRIADGVRSALGRLGEKDRELLLLLHGEDGPRYCEVSRRVNRPVGSLGPTRQRLLKRLRVDPAVRQLRPAAV